MKRSRRVALLAGLFAIVLIGTTATASYAQPFPNPNWIIPEPWNPISALFLGYHNFYRARHCVSALTWSTQLADGAQQYADHQIEPGSTFSQHSGVPGENLSWAKRASPIPTFFNVPAVVVSEWYHEINNYDYNKSEYTGDTGHFTQVIWRDTTQLGCAIARYSSPYGSPQDLYAYIVCRYSPAGNDTTKMRENVLPPCH